MKTNQVARHPLFREDNMLSMLMNIHKLHWVDEHIPYIANKDGECLDVDEFEFLNITPTELTIDCSGEKMVCDGILFFGDGTIEFHDKESEDAIHWEYFDEKSLVIIETILSKVLFNPNIMLTFATPNNKSIMGEKKMDFDEYWSEVGKYFGIKDKIDLVDGCTIKDEWDGDEVIIFRNSVGCILSIFNKDKEIAIIF